MKFFKLFMGTNSIILSLYLRNFLFFFALSILFWEGSVALVSSFKHDQLVMPRGILSLLKKLSFFCTFYDIFI